MWDRDGSYTRHNILNRHLLGYHLTLSSIWYLFNFNFQFKDINFSDNNSWCCIEKFVFKFSEVQTNFEPTNLWFVIFNHFQGSVKHLKKLWFSYYFIGINPSLFVSSDVFYLICFCWYVLSFVNCHLSCNLNQAWAELVSKSAYQFFTELSSQIRSCKILRNSAKFYINLHTLELCEILHLPSSYIDQAWAKPGKCSQTTYNCG